MSEDTDGSCWQTPTNLNTTGLTVLLRRIVGEMEQCHLELRAARATSPSATTRSPVGRQRGLHLGLGEGRLARTAELLGGERRGQMSHNLDRDQRALGQVHEGDDSRVAVVAVVGHRRVPIGDAPSLCTVASIGISVVIDSAWGGR